MIGVYAALFELSITAIVVKDPPATHMDVSAEECESALAAIEDATRR